MKTRKLLLANQVRTRTRIAACALLVALGQGVQVQAVDVLSALSGEGRRTHLYSEEADKTLTTKIADGWYPEENSPSGPFRWMSAAANVDVTARRKGTLVIRAHVRSFVAGNSLEVFVDDKPVQSIKLNGTEWQDFLVRVPSFLPGSHRLSLRSHQPGTQPPGDNRSVTICVEDFQATLEL
jgi:hypothetical protein